MGIYRDSNNFDIVVLDNEKIHLELNLSRGLIINSLRVNDDELIYIDKENYASNERPRCGCPILFPYSGNNENNVLKIKNNSYPTGIHGLVHTNSWQLISQSENTAVFVTTDNDFSLKSYPFNFELKCEISLRDFDIEYKMFVTNKSEGIMPCDCGFHPFFVTENFKEAVINVDDISSFDYEKIASTGQMFENVRTIKFASNKHYVDITLKEGLRNVLLWSGKPDKFLVVEPLTSKPNAINDKANAYNIEPNKTICVIWRMAIR